MAHENYFHDNDEISRAYTWRIYYFHVFWSQILVTSPRASIIFPCADLISPSTHSILPLQVTYYAAPKSAYKCRICERTWTVRVKRGALCETSKIPLGVRRKGSLKWHRHSNQNWNAACRLPLESWSITKN